MGAFTVKLCWKYGNDTDKIFGKLIFEGELSFLSEDGNFGIKVGAELFEKRKTEAKQSVFFYDFNFADAAGEQKFDKSGESFLIKVETWADVGDNFIDAGLFKDGGLPG